MERRTRLAQTAGEFAVLVAILVGGAVLTSTLGEHLSAPTLGIAEGLALAFVAALGVGWLVVAGPDGRPIGFAAGLGGGLGVLAGTTLLGTLPTGVVAGFGAGAFAVAAMGLSPSQARRE